MSTQNSSPEQNHPYDCPDCGEGWIVDTPKGRRCSYCETPAKSEPEQPPAINAESVTISLYGAKPEALTTYLTRNFVSVLNRLGKLEEAKGKPVQFTHQQIRNAALKRCFEIGKEYEGDGNATVALWAINALLGDLGINLEAD